MLGQQTLNLLMAVRIRPSEPDYLAERLGYGLQNYLTWFNSKSSLLSR